MFLRLIKMNLKFEEQYLGSYDNFTSLNIVLDEMMIESDEYLILEVCDAKGDIYFEEKINAYGGLSNKEQNEIIEALARIEKQKEMPILDISAYQSQLTPYGCTLALPDFNDEDAQLIIICNQVMDLPVGFYLQDDKIICDLIGNHELERQEDFKEQIQFFIDYLTKV